MQLESLKNSRFATEVESEVTIYDYFVSSVLIYKALLTTDIDGPPIDNDTVSMVMFTDVDDLEFNPRGDHFRGMVFMLQSNNPDDADCLDIKVHLRSNWFVNDLQWVLAKTAAVKRMRIGMAKDDVKREEQLELAREKPVDKMAKYSLAQLWAGDVSDSD